MTLWITIQYLQNVVCTNFPKCFEFRDTLKGGPFIEHVIWVSNLSKCTRTANKFCVIMSHGMMTDLPVMRLHVPNEKVIPRVVLTARVRQSSKISSDIRCYRG